MVSQLKYILFIAVTGLILVTQAAYAGNHCSFEDPTPLMDHWSDQGVFHWVIEGEILGTYAGPRIMESLKDYAGEKTIKITLNSGGGQVELAYLIEQRLNEWKKAGASVEIRVPRCGIVASAAILILAAGTQRIADSSASLGLHAGRDMFSGELAAESTERYINRLIDLGVSREFLDQLRFLKVFSNTAISWITPRDALTGRLLTEITESEP